MNKKIEVISDILNALDIHFVTCLDTCYPKDDILIFNLGGYSSHKPALILEDLAQKLCIDHEKINTAVGKVWRDWLKAFNTCPIQAWDKEFCKPIYYEITREKMAARLMSLFGKIMPGIKKDCSITVNRYSHSYRVDLECECDHKQDFFSICDCVEYATELYKIEELFNWALENEMLDKEYTLACYIDWYDTIGYIILKAFDVKITYHVTEPERLEVHPADVAPKETT